MAAIVEADRLATSGQVILVAALPGSGKTSLLQKLVSKSSVATTYMMFNRKPCDEFREFVEREKIENVYVTTFHKFAFDAVRECGISILMRNGDNGEQKLPQEIQNLMKENRVDNVSQLLVQMPVLAERWFKKASSGDWNACSEVVFYWMAQAKHLPELLATTTVNRLLSSKKLYVDEAQDCTPNMVKLIQMAADNGAAVTIAGDTNQSINGFMGACDPVGNYRFYFPEAKRFPLSISWRFGQEIADAFNAVTGEGCVGRPGEVTSAQVDIVIQSGTNVKITTLLDFLKSAGIKSMKRGKESTPVAGVVEVSTVFQAKGGGWHTCIVMNDVLPNAYDWDKEQDKKLVATALSRARERLYVQRRVAFVYGIKPSERVKVFEDLSDLCDVLAECGKKALCNL